MSTTIRLFVPVFVLSLSLLSGCGDKSATTAQEKPWEMPTIQSASPEIVNLMKRGHLSLEESDWNQASEHFENVLKIDVEYAPAHIGKLCAELRVRSEKDLGDQARPISNNRNFELAVRFADAAYKKTLNGYEEKIQERIRQELYDRLVQAKNEATKGASKKVWRELAEQFRAMNGYKNTVALAKECDAMIAEKPRVAATNERKVLKNKGVEYAFRLCPTGTFKMGEGQEQHSVRGCLKLKPTAA